MNLELIANCNQEVEERLLVRRETAAMNSSSSPFFDEPCATTDRFSLLHQTNVPPCTSGNSHVYSTTSASSSSSGSHKRPSSENPSAYQPKPKKPNSKEDSGNFLSGFAKIPLSSLPIENLPSLRRCISDPYSPPIAPLVEESPHSPTPITKIECPGTPLSNAIASAKLPPRPPTLKRSMSDPIPSPAKTCSSSCGSPNPEWLRKMRNCTREMSRKWDEVLGYEEDSDNAEMNRTTDNNGDDNYNCLSENRNNEATMVEKSQEGFIEAVSVEKKGEALIIHFECPCCAEYQILLLGGNCYYKLL